MYNVTTQGQLAWVSRYVGGHLGLLLVLSGWLGKVGLAYEPGLVGSMDQLDQLLLFDSGKLPYGSLAYDPIFVNY